MLLVLLYGRKKAYITRKLPIISPIKANIETRNKKQHKKAVQLSNSHKTDIKKQRKIKNNPLHVLVNLGRLH